MKRIWLAALSLSFAVAAQEHVYDPLVLPSGELGEPLDLTVADAERGRDVPTLVYLPDRDTPAPVILFSHGLGGSRRGCAYLGEHWAARGFVAVFLQHPGSDDSVWKDTAPDDRMRAMQRAASLGNLLERVRDVPAVLDRLAVWNADAEHACANRLDLARVGMSGHSFGAVTTQAVSGQALRGGARRFTDARIKAALAFSPSSPRRGEPAEAFGAVAIPWMLMTGTHDVARIGDTDLASRLAVYPNLPASIDRYELVLDRAEHSAFTERALPGDAEPRNPNHHRVILALSTAFWECHLAGDAAAREWLHGDGVAQLLEKGDRWQLGEAE